MNEHAREIAEAITWLNKESQHVQFGAIGITLILHAGKIVRVERTTMEKTLAADERQDTERER